MTHPSFTPPRSRAGILALVAFCAATPLLIPLRSMIPGTLLWGASAALLLREPEAAVRRRLGTLLACVAILALAPIHTDTSPAHFLTLGLPFLAVILGPALFLGRYDPGVIRYRLIPRRFRRLDLAYVLTSIPLTWLAFELYFKVTNPEVPFHWALPATPHHQATWGLFIGINCVGIWDELFFVNTVYATLRSVFPYRVANLAQAVVYTSVLTRMAFTGIGPVLIYIFALTQGIMFEESESLLYVLVVHLIVDAFLVAGILGAYYPGHALLPF